MGERERIDHAPIQGPPFRVPFTPYYSGAPKAGGFDQGVGSRISSCGFRGLVVVLVVSSKYWNLYFERGLFSKFHLVVPVVSKKKETS